MYGDAQLDSGIQGPNQAEIEAQGANNKFHEQLAALTPQETNKAGDQKIAAQTATPQEKTPIERLEGAVEVYEKNGHKLTPEIKKDMEDIIAKSDVPSPLVPGLEKAMADKKAEAEKWLTPEKQAEIKTAKEAVNDEFKKLSPEDQQTVGMLNALRGLAGDDADAKKQIDDQIKAAAPALSDKLTAFEKVTEPLQKMQSEFGETAQKLAVEQSQALVTRGTYTQMLLENGDKDGASKQIKDIVTKAPQVLDSEEFQGLIKAAGLKVEDFRPKKEKE